jgi:drug/metabolite transporter (DMT)-like permease
MSLPAGTKAGSVASLALCAFLWSTAGILLKLVDWDPFAIAGGRSLVGFLSMWLFVRRPRFTFSRNQILAAFFYSATMFLFILANKMTTSANAVLLQYMEPIFIVILGRYLLRDETATGFDWLIIAGVLGGMVLFFLDDLSLQANLGNLLAILSGVTFALMTIFMRRQKDSSPTESIMLAHLLTVAVAIPFMLRAGPPDARGAAGLLLLGFFQVGLSSLFYGIGVRGVSALGTSLITMIEPVFNPVWVAIFAREYPSPRAAAGGAIILACVAARTVLKARKV